MEKVRWQNATVLWIIGNRLDGHCSSLGGAAEANRTTRRRSYKIDREEIRRGQGARQCPMAIRFSQAKRKFLHRDSFAAYLANDIKGARAESKTERPPEIDGPVGPVGPVTHSPVLHSPSSNPAYPHHPPIILPHGQIQEVP